MKRTLVVILVVILLFVFSSCSYSYQEVNDKIDELDNKWSSNYSELEEKYYSVSKHAEELEDALCKIQDDYITASSYYSGESLNYTEDEAFSALEDIGYILVRLGY